MDEQMSLLDYVPEPIENALPPLPTAEQVRVNRLAEFWQAKAALYLRLIRQFMEGTLLSVELRRHEINRLYLLREQALNEMKMCEEGDRDEQ